MTGEEIEVKNNKVKVVGKSDIFHFIISSKDSLFTSNSGACRRPSTFGTRDVNSNIDVNEAMSNGKRPCKKCIKKLRQQHDIEVMQCEVCRATNLTNNATYLAVDIEHGVSSDHETYFCSRCINKLQKPLDKKGF